MGDDPMALLGLEGALKHYYYYYYCTECAPGQTERHAETLIARK
jgi:hypothetical protein